MMLAMMRPARATKCTRFSQHDDPEGYERVNGRVCDGVLVPLEAMYELLLVHEVHWPECKAGRDLDAKEWGAKLNAMSLVAQANQDRARACEMGSTCKKKQEHPHWYEQAWMAPVWAAAGAGLMWAVYEMW